MRQYFCLSPRGVEAGGGTARVILREEEVLVNLLQLLLIYKPNLNENLLSFPLYHHYYSIGNSHMDHSLFYRFFHQTDEQ